jgi:3'-phosphoadenosine 5'-phosphosulfate sulfotransferase (PAPS reductase)/FAD synthetase
MDSSEFYLEDLKSKFMKINPSDYYLAYSGGRDSHFLYWFIKEYLKDDRIEIVSMNTGLEHAEIANRMKANADRILRPTKSYNEIKENYGIPCFSKQQDKYIYGYRQQIAKGIPITKTYRECVELIGQKGLYAISQKAHDWLFSGDLHKVSHLCCYYMKKQPANNYAKESNKKPIMGIMAEESRLRKMHIASCFNQKKYFYPIFDLSNEIQSKIEEKYGIEVPDIYRYVSQTGCVGCPYGITHGETIKELSLCTPQQRKFVLDYFKESYEVRGLFYQYKFNF